MKTFAIDEFGGRGSIQEAPVPEPDPGQVRLRVAAAGLNPFDSAVIHGMLKDMMEHRFPLVPGMDASGTVDAVGDDVSAWRVGDEVFGSVGKPQLGEGTLAEFVTLSSGTIARKPAEIDHRSAAAIPTAGVTALLMADALALEKGQVVIALGATGGVGSYFVQIATRRGAHVVAVCSTANLEYAKTIGAAEVLDYTSVDVVAAVGSGYPEGVDAVADMHGDKDVVGRLAQHVRGGGRVASVVGAADEAPAERGIVATNVRGIVTSSSLEALAGMVKAGDITSPPIRTFSLDDAADALEMVGSGHVRGKVVALPT